MTLVGLDQMVEDAMYEACWTVPDGLEGMTWRKGG